MPVPKFMEKNALQSIAEKINTRTEDPETSRALVVFNLTPHLQSGVAVFRAAMAWPKGVPLPPVVITDSGGVSVPSAVQDMTEGPDTKNRADRVHLQFAIQFAAADIPANGWRTYIASYTDAPGPSLDNAPSNAELVAVETTRHGGDLPMTGVLEPAPANP